METKMPDVMAEFKKGNFGLDPRIFSQRAPVRELKKTINHQLIQQRALLKAKVEGDLDEYASAAQQSV